MFTRGDVVRECKRCGKSFISYAKRNRKYCSHKCSRDFGPVTHGESGTRLHAALAYDRLVFEERGEFAFLNFPERKILYKHKEVQSAGSQKARG